MFFLVDVMLSVFTAGVGENSISTRKEILNKLAVLGIKVDEEG